MQERRNSIADALELRLSCTNPQTDLNHHWPSKGLLPARSQAITWINADF